MSVSKNNKLAIVLVTSLFFFWGFVHNLDPILIPHLRNAFSLTHLQASLVDSAVFIAYFLLAIPAGMIMKKYGYKSGILIGLTIFAIGCFLFIPAANQISYVFFLTALFVVACGLTILETAANPYVTVLGDPSKATQRLNFAQSFNGLAAFIAPILGGKFILAEQPKSDTEIAAMSEQVKLAYMQAETATVKAPYMILGLIILIVAAILFFTKLPDIKDDEGEQKAGFFHAFKHKNVKWGVIGQFFYVGAQVCVLSFMVLYATEVAGITPLNASKYASFAGLAFMLGRFVGTFFMKFIQPLTLLMIYSIICIALSFIVIYGSGTITVYALIAVAFFMSIMFPTIFAVGVEGIGADTKSASSLIIMSIVGGAVLPPLLGLISDKTGNLQLGYWVPMICFVVVLLFSLANKNNLKTQSSHE
ncbi:MULTISPECIES: L-fucose:H+ symporter permease [unclassified Sphingobacterium]|uniref:L-fucose:H+ symporter permease n=2 Tax=Sphingobacterium TaxID=28453 RepID=UPI001044BC3F|nr:MULTISPECIES: L-fucose:H+ symporter permease [unclassified Sphingobacterium]MCS3554631.1 FHS family L-fucose permease-like MFS transporter [Sphingobacterium sp. JUb21]TCR07621.1 FHS family L-fucose permease-like MFS transporter [Sphingobacterium sp. JUb20]